MTELVVYMGLGCVILGLAAWEFFSLYRKANRRAKEYKKDLEIKTNEVKALQQQAAIYAEEKRKYEQKLNEAASHNRPGFNSSLDLMQQLNQSGTGRNN